MNRKELPECLSLHARDALKSCGELSRALVASDHPVVMDRTALDAAAGLEAVAAKNSARRRKRPS